MNYNDFKSEIMHPQRRGKIINALDFGLNTENKNNCDALIAAFSACKEQNAGVLYIPSGTYYFVNTNPIEINDINNLLIDAENVEFIYSFYNAFLKFKNCECVEIKGLTIDWDWSENRIASLVKVVNYSIKNHTVDYEFLEKGKININQPWKSANTCDPVTFTPGVEDGKEFDGYGEVTYLGEKIYRVNIRPSHFRYLNPLFFRKDNVHLVRHYWYGGVVLDITDCYHFSLTNFTIYSCPGCAIFVWGHSHHLHFNNLKITIKPDTDRHISAGADAFHIGSSNGYIYVENSEFGYQGDDGINIHNRSFKDIIKLGENLISMPKKYLSLISIDDNLEFRNLDLSDTGYFSNVKEIIENDEVLEITLTEPIPSELKNFIIFNHAYDSSNYIFKNCYFHENRARGILMQSDNGVVENCHFYKIQGAAIQIETGISTSWSEGYGVNNLLIKNNIFENCDCNDWCKGVIYMSSYLPNGLEPAHMICNSTSLTSTVGDCGVKKRTAYPIFSDIKILNNTFIEFPRFAAVLSSFDDLKFKNNKIINRHPFKTACFERGTVWLELGKNAYFEDNEITPSEYSNTELVKQHPETTENIIIK